MITAGTISHKNTKGLVPGGGLYPAAMHSRGAGTPTLNLTSKWVPPPSGSRSFPGTCVRRDRQGQRGCSQIPRGGFLPGRLSATTWHSPGWPSTLPPSGNPPCCSGAGESSGSYARERLSPGYRSTGSRLPRSQFPPGCPELLIPKLPGYLLLYALARAGASYGQQPGTTRCQEAGESRSPPVMTLSPELPDLPVRGRGDSGARVQALLDRRALSSRAPFQPGVTISGLAWIFREMS